MSIHRSKPTTIPATKVHRNFGEILRRAYAGEEFIVEKDGLPVAAVISMADYEELARVRLDREERLKRFQENARVLGKEAERLGITEEELMEQLEQIKREVYEEYYGSLQSEAASHHG
jgi:prevent-host-death family protein